MASFVEPLVLARVVGEVVDFFIPSATMSVSFGPKYVSNGCDIKPSMALNPPKIKISGLPNELYTLAVIIMLGMKVMVDPDSPSPSKPTMREWVHWIVTDIPGGSNPSKGKEILPYMCPCPMIGIHRFIFVLFRQKGPMDLLDVPESRLNFNTRLFAAHFDLGLPAAVVYFNSQKEPAPKRR